MYNAEPEPWVDACGRPHTFSLVCVAAHPQGYSFADLVSVLSVLAVLAALLAVLSVFVVVDGSLRLRLKHGFKPVNTGF